MYEDSFLESDYENKWGDIASGPYIEDESDESDMCEDCGWFECICDEENIPEYTDTTDDAILFMP